MRNILAAAFAFVVLIGIANPAAASGSHPCCGDDKPPSKVAQKNACKKTSGDTYKACAELAKLPAWWMSVKDGNRTINVHVVSGVELITNLRDTQPYWTLKQEFRNNIKAYRDQHVTVPLS